AFDRTSCHANALAIHLLPDLPSTVDAKVLLPDPMYCVHTASALRPYCHSPKLHSHIRAPLSCSFKSRLVFLLTGAEDSEPGRRFSAFAVIRFLRGCRRCREFVALPR